MSSPIFFQRYVDGQAVNFDRDTITRILGAAAVMDGDTIAAIQFSDDDGGEVYGADADSFEQLSFDEGEGERFFDALWRIADETDSFIYWLGDGRCSAVTKPATIAQLPADVVDDTGPVRVARTGAELESMLDG
jgi:hypothetical protein